MERPVDPLPRGPIDSAEAAAPPDSHRDRTKAAVRHHVELLIGSLAIVLLSLAFRVGADGAVQVGQDGWLRLPPLCGSRILFNVDCPACGLTRSFVFLAHGDWAEAAAAHRVGWVVALALLAQIPYRIVAIRRRQARPLGGWPVRFIAWVVIAALLINWLACSLGY